ncbi:MAG: ABC transporter ATP-binding protein [Spirochaetales bacterium]|nr:ABC transporter ATP-binding protein [Spirochaetales bacterium]
MKSKPLFDELREEGQDGRFNPHVIRRILSYLKPYKKVVALALFGLIVATAASLLAPVIIQKTVDNYILASESGTILTRAEQYAGIKRNSLIYLGLLGLSLIFSFAQVYLTAMTSQYVMRDMRKELFAHLLNQSLAFLGGTPIGSLVSRVTSDVEKINDFFTSVALAVLKDIALMGGIFLTLFLMNSRLALVVVVTLPPVFLLTIFIRNRIRQVYREVQHETSRVNAFIAESVGGMDIVQLFNRQKRFKKDFGGLNGALYKASMNEIYLFSFFRPLVSFFTSVSLGCLLYFGTGLHNSGVVTLGVLIAFINLVEQFYQPMRDITELITVTQSAMAGGERVFALLDRDESIPDEGRFEPEKVAGELAFEKVCFCYKENEPVLRGLSFTARAGETVAVVGTTGAGKTTIANMLARFWDRQEGSITLDGRDVKDYSLKSLRSHIQSVQQDVTLFSGSVRENIALGKDISDEEIHRALEIVRADHFVKELPYGLDTLLSEGAENISAGQRQLLSFARIFVHNPSVVILDEATSSIDTQTESWIQEGMANLLKDRTALVIAHRLSTIKKADRILVLGKGTLLEEGTHRELIDREGVYYNLYKLQYEQEAAL